MLSGALIAAVAFLAGCGDDDTDAPPETVTIGGADERILDSEYVARRLFSLDDPREWNDPSLTAEIAIFRTTRDPAEDSRAGRETLQAHGSLRGDDVGTVVIDDVARLVVNDDYVVTSIRGAIGRVVILRYSLPDDQRLYTSYFEPGGGVPPDHVGNYWNSRSPGEVVRLKIMALKATDFSDQPLPTEFIEKTLRLERRNVYDLEHRDINPETLRLTIRRLGGADPTRIDGLELLTATGLDRLNNRTFLGCFGGQTTTSTSGPDGIVDNTWIDGAIGYVVFPDEQPFDPEIDDLIDSSTGFVWNDCRTRAIGWKLENPTAHIRGDESYHRVAEVDQAVERNSALYRGLRAGPLDTRYEITGSYEVAPE